MTLGFLLQTQLAELCSDALSGHFAQLGLEMR